MRMITWISIAASSLILLVVTGASLSESFAIQSVLDDAKERSELGETIDSSDVVEDAKDA